MDVNLGGVLARWPIRSRTCFRLAIPFVFGTDYERTSFALAMEGVMICRQP